ncbi:unnamed protein product [Rotaria socialis]|uniref:Uncharacterized protein n=2 Tax=Rotaria socialis TaxID=392032 RepID=A0A818ID43_9BILA|nr:unnamed protein product [Rotaria socialis]CAF3517954.1 unnamed protein product [Rotaria socialis]CAF3758171.1 unnamed protein product [Rotaria socialis]CAF4427466.1 unnamed protein product [Rotaria socialis]CAF4480583.1 unnamed protein product [Rotaria socialis]
MSDQHVPHHLRDIDNPPSYLTEAQQQNWISAAKKAKKNYQRKQQYPPFIVPPQFIDTNVNTNAINYHTTAPSLSRPCHCHESSPYRINEKWSLQQAVIFIYKIFIDKNETFNHWAHGLDPIVSTLPEAKRLSMIRYAIYDCFATTLLARPIIEYWPFTKIENSGITELFQKARSPLSINPNITISNIYQKSHQKSKKHITTNLELISDDDDDNDNEIYLNQCRAPVRQALPTYEPISEDEITINQHHLSTCTTLPMYEPISDDEQSQIVSPDAPTQEINIQSESEMNIPPEQPQPPTLISLHRSRHNRRTATARRHRNKKRNDTHRSHRYRYYVTRPVHHRFSMASIKVILERHNIRYTHIKIRNSSLIIGLKHHHMKHQAHQQLPYATFNRLQYYEHHRRSRESRHHHSHESRHHYFYESRHYHYHDSRYHRHRHHSRHTHYAT